MYKLMLIGIIIMIASTIYIFKQLDNNISKARLAHSTELAQLDAAYNIQ